jgi:hypothetical protein
MAPRTRQIIFGVLLVVPLVWAAATIPPLAAEPSAQAANRMLGPNFPPLVDTNGDGRPTEGVDQRMVPTRLPSSVRVANRWNCQIEEVDDNNEASFSNPSGGRWQTVTRFNHLRSQIATAGGFINPPQFPGTRPTSFSFVERTLLGQVRATGTGSVVDGTGDGIYDTIQGAGNMSFLIGLVYSDVTGDNNADYASIPWSQASMVGVRFGDGCGDPDPQVWLPIADSNGDGRPDSIVLDLNGDNTADPDMFPSPPIAGAPQVPTMTPWTLMLLVGMLGALGLWSLTLRPGERLGPAA